MVILASYFIIISSDLGTLSIDNFTRFFVLSHSMEAKLPFLPHRPDFFRALIRLGVLIAEGDDSQTSVSANRPLQLVISTLLTTFGVPVTRIDRRPSLGSTPFEDVYFIELEELGAPPDPSDLGDRGAAYGKWLNKVQHAVDRAKTSGVEATLLGAW